MKTIRLPEVLKKKIPLSVVPIDQYFGLSTIDGKLVMDDVTSKWFVICLKTQAEAEQRLAEIKKEMAKTEKGKK
jgi:hypothetical protein